MLAPHRELPQQHPLTTRWNPQLDLFLEAPAIQPAPAGPLAAAVWQQQERRLARGMKPGAWHTLAGLADRARPAPGTPPRLDEYAWTWPGFTSLAMDERFADAPLSRFVLTALQAEEHLATLSELLREIGQHVAFALSRPCPVYETPQTVRVEFLGCLAFVANRATRMLLLELRDARGDWQLSVQAFDLDRPLADAGWIDQALLPWLPAIETAFGAGAPTAHEWLREKLLQHFDQPRHLAATGRQIRHCLLFVPALARVLRQVAPYRPARELQSVTYSRLWIRVTTWAELDRIAPQLVLFYYLALRQQAIQPGQHLGVLRAYALQLGLSPAGWRFLCRFGEWAYDGLLLFDVPGEDAMLIGRLVAWIEWQARAGLSQPLPTRYALSLEQAGAFRWRPELRVAVVVDPRLARVTEAHAPAPRGAGRAPIDVDEWTTVLRWLVQEQPKLDANQWRAGWPAICRARDRWLCMRLDLSWDSRVGPFTVDGWSVRPLTSGRDLVAEGRRMQHCVARYIRACHEGRYRIFAVERAETGVPAATIGLRHANGEWRLHQVKGQRNAEAGEGMERIGALVLERYRDASRSTNGPRFC